MNRFIPALLVAALASTAPAAVFEPREFDDAGQRAAYRRLTAELRCLVCQNQSIADSDAELAADLREEVYRMVRSGSGESEVVGFMVDRYGDFVRYRPPLNAATVALWLGPFVAAAAALGWLVRRVRQAPAAPEPLSDAERQRLGRLLDRTRTKQDDGE